MTITNNEIEESENDDLYEHHRYVVDKGQKPLRIDKYLMNYIEGATRNKIQTAAKEGTIFVNDIAVKSNYKVKPGEVIRVMFTHPPYEYLLVPEDIPLDIVFEDDHLIVVNKPAGMVVHPAAGHSSGTLVNAVLGYDPEIEGIGGERGWYSWPLAWAARRHRHGRRRSGPSRRAAGVGASSPAAEPTTTHAHAVGQRKTSPTDE